MPDRDLDYIKCIMGIYSSACRLSVEECESLIAFIKMHEREEIPDDVWEICMKLQDFCEEEE